MKKGIFLKKLGERVAELRKQKKLSQSDLARLAEKDRQSIHRLEKGQINPSVYYLYEIAGALKHQVKDLIDF